MLDFVNGAQALVCLRFRGGRRWRIYKYISSWTTTTKTSIIVQILTVYGVVIHLNEIQFCSINFKIDCLTSFRAVWSFYQFIDLMHFECFCTGIIFYFYWKCSNQFLTEICNSVNWIMSTNGKPNKFIMELISFLCPVNYKWRRPNWHSIIRIWIHSKKSPFSKSCEYLHRCDAFYIVFRFH